MKDAVGGAPAPGRDSPVDGGDRREQPVVVSIYVLIAMAGEVIFVIWLLTPLFAGLLA